MRKSNYALKILTMALVITTAWGCAKDGVLKQDESLSKTQLDKIQRYISITWETPLSQVMYDSVKQQFTFGKNNSLTASKENMVRIYNNANNYKAQYEKL